MASLPAFPDSIGQDWEVTAKNTFIQFDTKEQPSARQRSSTCPARPQSGNCDEDEIVWVLATQELCHAMYPRRRVEAVSLQEPQPVEVDAISQVSTTSSERSHEEAALALPEQTWTSVPTKRKVKPSAVAEVPKEVSRAPPARKQPVLRERASSRQRNDGKGKGLSHFMRVEVGIEDDRDFRVVQRLIGPRGKNMQDITYRAKGAKVWIIGRGSRSWEDDEGPLMVCVGAPTENAFNTAHGLVQDLLARVHEDKRKFEQSLRR